MTNSKRVVSNKDYLNTYEQNPTTPYINAENPDKKLSGFFVSTEVPPTKTDKQNLIYKPPQYPERKMTPPKTGRGVTFNIHQVCWFTMALTVYQQTNQTIDRQIPIHILIE